MRVVHIDSETGYSEARLQVFLLMEGLRARGHHVLLVCPPGSASEVQARRAASSAARFPCAARSTCALSFAVAGDLAVRPTSSTCTPAAPTARGLGARCAGVPAVSTRR